MKNLFRMPIMATILSSAILSSNVSAVPETLEKAKEIVMEGVYALIQKESITLNFAAGSSKLSKDQELELKTTLKGFKDHSKLKQIVVVAYSDKPYPGSPSGSLPVGSRTLATDRAHAVRSEFSKQGVRNIVLYNMAESANWFERFLVTTNAQVKHEAKEKRANQTREDEFFEGLGKHLMSAGGPGKVIIIMRRK